MSIKRALEGAKRAVLGADETPAGSAGGEGEADPASTLGLGYHGIFSMKDTVPPQPGADGTFATDLSGGDEVALPASEAPRGGSTTLPASEDADHTVGS